ncbi:MAG TPA: pentapeptide repeat-containing protein, partial [Beijerinckia sp.]|nr:pentapeptide repeat-containing protein [Beijerinckia sp.]
VMEILCAYVRKNAGPPQPCSLEMRATYAKADQTDEERISRRHRKAELKAATDVQACLTVIGRRSQKQRDWETTKKATEADGAGSGAFRLDLRACHLAGADLSGLHFDKANFEGACLEGTTLDEARLQGALLDDVHLEGASLEKAHLESASLVGAHIEGAWLSGVRLADASLGGARLKGSSLYGADLEGAELYWVELDDAELDDAHLEGASLEGAWLFRAHLKGAKDLTQAQLESAYGDETTELPEGLSRPSHWIKLSNDSDATADLAPDTEAK